MASFFDPEIFDTDIFDTTLPAPVVVDIPTGHLHVGRFKGDPQYSIDDAIITHEHVSEGQVQPNVVVVDGQEHSWSEYDRANLIERDTVISTYLDLPELKTLGEVRQRAVEELTSGRRANSPGGEAVWQPWYSKMDNIYWFDEDGNKYETRIEGLRVAFAQGLEPFQRATIDTGVLVFCEPGEDAGEYLARDLFDRDTPSGLGEASIGGDWVVTSSTYPITPPPPPDEDWPTMFMWLPNWQSMDTAAVTAVANDMVYMQQDGVVLKGMDWGSEYSLPDDVSDYLDIFIGLGIQPFLDLHTGKMDIDDQTVAQACIDAGDGKWAGIICDAENQWVQHVRNPPDGVGATQARIDFDAFMAIVRPATDKLGIAGYASPTSFPNFKYGWWNEEVDVLLPLAYFNDPSDTPQGILDTMYRKFEQAHDIQDWTEPVKPIIPVVNGYNAELTDAQVALREEYIQIAFERAGAVSIWRWIIDFPDNMREMLHSIEVPSE